MSMRTSVQKRDEKQPTFDDIKKIGYLMRVKNTAMDVNPLSPPSNKRRASPKKTPPTEPGGASLDPTPDTPDTEPGRTSSDPTPKTPRMPRAPVPKKAKSEETTKRQKRDGDVEEPGDDIEKLAISPKIPPQNDMEVEDQETVYAEAQRRVEKAKAHLAAAKEEEDEARNTNKDLATKVESVNEKEGLTAAGALNLKAMRKELEDSEEELDLAVWRRQHAQEKLEVAQRDLESAQKKMEGGPSSAYGMQEKTTGMDADASERPLAQARGKEKRVESRDSPRPSTPSPYDETIKKPSLGAAKTDSEEVKKAKRRLEEADSKVDVLSRRMERLGKTFKSLNVLDPKWERMDEDLRALKDELKAAKKDRKKAERELVLEIENEAMKKLQGDTANLTISTPKNMFDIDNTRFDDPELQKAAFESLIGVEKELEEREASERSKAVVRIFADDPKVQLEAAKKRVKEAEDRVASARKKVDDLKVGYEKALRNPESPDPGALRRKLHASKEELKEAENNLASEKTIEGVIELQLKEKEARKDMEVEDQKPDYAEAQRRVEDKKPDYAEAQKRVEEAEANLAEAEKEEVEATKKVTDFNAEIASVNEQRDFKNEPDGRDPRIQAMIEELGPLEDELEVRQHKLEEAREKLKVARRDLESAQKKKEGGSSSAFDMQQKTTGMDAAPSSPSLSRQPSRESPAIPGSSPVPRVATPDPGAAKAVENAQRESALREENVSKLFQRDITPQKQLIADFENAQTKRNAAAAEFDAAEEKYENAVEKREDFEKETRRVMAEGNSSEEDPEIQARKEKMESLLAIESEAKVALEAAKFDLDEAQLAVEEFMQPKTTEEAEAKLDRTADEEVENVLREAAEESMLRQVAEEAEVQYNNAAREVQSAKEKLELQSQIPFSESEGGEGMDSRTLKGLEDQLGEKEEELVIAEGAFKAAKKALEDAGFAWKEASKQVTTPEESSEAPAAVEPATEARATSEESAADEPAAEAPAAEDSEPTAEAPAAVEPATEAPATSEEGAAEAPAKLIDLDSYEVQPVQEKPVEKSLERSKYPHDVPAANLESFSLPERFEIESVHLKQEWTKFSNSEDGMAVIHAKHLGRSDDDVLNVTISAFVKKGASQPEKYFIVIDQTEDVTLEYTNGKHIVTYTSISESSVIGEDAPPESFRYNRPGRVGFDIVNCSVNVTSSAELPHLTIENVDNIQLEGKYPTDPEEEPNKYFTASIEKLDLTSLKLVYGFFGGKTRFSNLEFKGSKDNTAFLENVTIKFQEENTNDFFYLFADPMSFLENRKENVTIQGELMIGGEKKFVVIQNDKIDIKNGSFDGTIETTTDFLSNFGLDSFSNFFLRGERQALLIDLLKKAWGDVTKAKAFLSELTEKVKMEYPWALEIGSLIVTLVTLTGPMFLRLRADDNFKTSVRRRDKEEIKEYLNKYEEVDLDFFMKQVKVTFFVDNTEEKKDRIENLNLMREYLLVNDGEKYKLQEAISFIEKEAKLFSDTFGKEQVTELLKLLGKEVEAAAEKGDSEG